MSEDNEGVGRIRQRYPLNYHRIKCYAYIKAGTQFCNNLSILKEEEKVWWI